MILKRFQWIIAHQSQIFFHIPHFAEENGYQYLIIYTAAYFSGNVMLLQFCSLNYFFSSNMCRFLLSKLKWSIFWHCFSQLKIILRVQKLPYKICLLSVSYDTLFFIIIFISHYIGLASIGSYYHRTALHKVDRLCCTL